MGKIRPPPRPVNYDGYKGQVIAQEKELEEFEEADYMRVLELVRWEDGIEELRFGYYYRAKGQGDDKWIPGQVYSNMSRSTLAKLIKKAKSNPEFGKALTGI